MQKLLLPAALVLVVGLMTVRGDQAQAGSAVTCGDVLTTDTADKPLGLFRHSTNHRC